MKLDNTEAVDSIDSCELFAKYFASVFSDSFIQIPKFNFNLNSTVPNCVISTLDVQRRLEKLDSNKGAGPDEIPPLILKYCAPVLAPHLAIWFSSLLTVGNFPSSLKRGFVVPVFKSGVANDVRNYRPIVIQSAIAKVFESIIFDHLYFHLRKCISQYQHGFQRGRSTVTNLLQFQEFAMSAIIDSCQLDCIYLDISKAFDKVSHSLLIAKLEGYGVHGSLLRWLSSYLDNRLLMVKCYGRFSLPFHVLSGVPQGSHLGPLLFCLFINDIGTKLSSRFLLFADDIKIFGRVQTYDDLQGLQRSLIGVEDWCRENAMELNVSKCMVVSFKRGHNIMQFDYVLNNTTLKRADMIKDLGVIMTSTLSPSKHIEQIISRANSLLGFIFRSTKDFNSPYTMVCLFISLVRPVLEYCSCIWSPYQQNHIEDLQSLQDRFIRLLGSRLGFTYRTTPVDAVAAHFGLSPLKLRRQHADLLILYKLINGILDCPDLLAQIDLWTPRGTRSMTVFRRRYASSNYAYYSGMSRIIRLGEEAATNIDFFNGSVQAFKHILIRELR